MSTKTSKRKWKRGKRLRRAIVKSFGGKCVDCGEDKYIFLTFHHLKPAQKLFTLCAKEIGKRTLEEIRAETKKCILLCRNCHDLIHEKEQQQHVEYLRYRNKMRRMLMLPV